MKTHIAAIGHNERELEAYVGQLKMQGFESLSDVKKAEDGTFYQVLAKAGKNELPQQEKAALEPIAAVTAWALIVEDFPIN